MTFVRAGSQVSLGWITGAEIQYRKVKALESLTGSNTGSTVLECVPSGWSKSRVEVPLSDVIVAVRDQFANGTPSMSTWLLQSVHGRLTVMVCSGVPSTATPSMGTKVMVMTAFCGMLFSNLSHMSGARLSETFSPY